MSTKQTRRAFLAGGATAATVVATTVVPASADGDIKVTELAKVKPGQPVEFNYPEGALAYLVDMGRKVPGGTGPNESLVAYSGLCQHRGCPVDYKSDQELFVCPCHRSIFDPSGSGVVVEGPSQRGLPRVVIEVRNGAVYATGIENGPVYGLACSNA